MRKIHTSPKCSRIKNGAPFDWMLFKMVESMNHDHPGSQLNITSMNRIAIARMWKELGLGEMPNSALDMLEINIDKLEL